MAEELTLGEEEEVLSLGDEPAVSEVATTLNSGDLRPELTTVEQWLLGDRNPGENLPKVIDRNLNVYRVFGLERFQDPSPVDLDRMEKWIALWIEEAKAKWERMQGERLSDITRVLQLAYEVLKNPKRREDHNQVLRGLSLREVFAVLGAKVVDRQVGPIELRDVLEAAKEKGLWNDVTSRREVLANLTQHLVNQGNRVLGAQEVFVAQVRQRPLVNRIDSEQTIAKLLDDYQNLAEAEAFNAGRETPGDRSQLRVSMDLVLQREGLSPLPKVPLFRETFLTNFLSSRGLDRKVPLDNDLFYAVKIAAQDQFGFSTVEWNEFLATEGLQKKPERELKFVFGKDSQGNRLEARNLDEIARLFEIYPERAIEKIYNSDLESYLSDAGHKDLEEKVRNLVARDYLQDRAAGRLKTLFLLQPDRPLTLDGRTECHTLAETAQCIEDNFSAFLRELPGTQNPPLVLWLEARGNGTLAQTIRSVLLDPSLDPIKRINGTIWWLQGQGLIWKERAFHSVREIVEMAPGAEKDRLARELTDPQSKVSYWVEHSFPDLQDQVDTWRRLGRINSRTLDYALEKGTPFHWDDDRSTSAQDFLGHLLDRKGDSRLLDSLVSPGEFSLEADFWLTHYARTSLEAVLLEFVRKLETSSESKPFTLVLGSLDRKLLGTMPLAQYFATIVPLYDEGAQNGALDSEEAIAHRTRLLGALAKDPQRTQDDVVGAYLAQKVDIPTADRELVWGLFRSFIRPQVERAYYQNVVHPLLQRAVKSGLLTQEALDVEQQFFLTKYGEEIVSQTFDEQMQTLEALQSLNKDHPLVTLYDQTLAEAELALAERNRRIRRLNGARRDLVIAGVLGVGALTSVVLSLHRFVSPAPMKVPVTETGLVLAGVLAVGLAGLLIWWQWKKRRS